MSHPTNPPLIPRYNSTTTGRKHRPRENSAQASPPSLKLRFDRVPWNWNRGCLKCLFRGTLLITSSMSGRNANPAQTTAFVMAVGIGTILI